MYYHNQTVGLGLPVQKQKRMRMTTSKVKGGRFTVFVYTDLRCHISNQINHQSFYHSYMYLLSVQSNADRLE